MGFLMGPIAANSAADLGAVSDSEKKQIADLGVTSVQVTFSREGDALLGVTAQDAKAVQATNFCSLWASAKPALQELQKVISNPFVKAAIATVIAAGDAYCAS